MFRHAVEGKSAKAWHTHYCPLGKSSVSEMPLPMGAKSYPLSGLGNGSHTRYGARTAFTLWLVLLMVFITCHTND
jgi:hypothetical protein